MATASAIFCLGLRFRRVHVAHSPRAPPKPCQMWERAIPFHQYIVHCQLWGQYSGRCPVAPFRYALPGFSTVRPLQPPPLYYEYWPRMIAYSPIRDGTIPYHRNNGYFLFHIQYWRDLSPCSSTRITSPHIHSFSPLYIMSLFLYLSKAFYSQHFQI